MRRSHGFSLVEVMVSIVILSVALLGSAGLITASLRSTNTSYYRSHATILADDIMDRMRANLPAARSQQYGIDPGPAYAAPSNSLARFDCEEWWRALGQVLPGGRGVLSVDPSGLATVEIQWDDDRAEDGIGSYTTRSQL